MCVGAGVHFAFILSYFLLSHPSTEGKQVLNCPHTRCGPVLEAAAVSGTFLPGHLKQREGNVGKWRTG